jgi:anti-sigma regulatory factor (Ser/Thr protein kinase)
MSTGNVPVGRSRKVSKYTLEPSTSSLTTLREFLKATLKPYPAVAPYLQDIVSATHEAAKNAVVHNPESIGPVDVTCEVRDDMVVVEVSDRGKGYHADDKPPAQPDPDSLAGRGMFIMYSLMDDVETRSDSHGTRVRLVKKLAPAFS